MPTFDEHTLARQARRERGLPDALLAVATTLFAVAAWAVALLVIAG